jgi:hypothetical protein
MANIDDFSAATSNLSLDTEPSATETATAVAQVLGTLELLESILSHLPVLDLVVATGVSKTFRQVIQESPQLQSQLFMLPTKDKAEYWQLVTLRNDNYRCGQRVAHLYRIKSPGIVGDDALEADLEAVAVNPGDWAHPNYSLKVVSVCPLLDPFERDGWLPRDLGLWERYEMPVETQLRVNSRALRAIKPWDNMFITNPPCQEASMRLIWEGYDAGKQKMTISASGMARCEQGITMALLVDRVAKTPGRVSISTRSDEHGSENVWKLEDAEDTTLHDQVAICKTRNSERVWQMSPQSSIGLSGMVAPSEISHNEMAVYGHVVTSAH